MMDCAMNCAAELVSASATQDIPCVVCGAPAVRYCVVLSSWRAVCRSHGMMGLRAELDDGAARGDMCDIGALRQALDDFATLGSFSAATMRLQRGALCPCMAQMAAALRARSLADFDTTPYCAMGHVSYTSCLGRQLSVQAREMLVRALCMGCADSVLDFAARELGIDIAEALSVWRRGSGQVLSDQVHDVMMCALVRGVGADIARLCAAPYARYLELLFEESLHKNLDASQALAACGLTLKLKRGDIILREFGCGAAGSFNLLLWLRYMRSGAYLARLLGIFPDCAANGVLTAEQVALAEAHALAEATASVKFAGKLE